MIQVSGKKVLLISCGKDEWVRPRAQAMLVQAVHDSDGAERDEFWMIGLEEGLTFKEEPVLRDEASVLCLRNQTL